MYSANDSLSHRSSHHFGVVMLPNHWCAISWATVVARWIRVAAGDPRGEDQRVAERHAAGVLHRAGVELGHERLVVVAERVADPEQPVELVEALLGHREQLVGVGVEGGGDALPGAEAERDAVVLVADHVVRPGDQGDEVRRQRLGRARTPTGRARPARRGRCRSRSSRAGARDVEGVRRLEVGLVEAGEDAGRGVHEATCRRRSGGRRPGRRCGAGPRRRCGTASPRRRPARCGRRRCSSGSRPRSSRSGSSGAPLSRISLTAHRLEVDERRRRPAT